MSHTGHPINQLDPVPQGAEDEEIEGENSGEGMEV